MYVYIGAWERGDLEVEADGRVVDGSGDALRDGEDVRAGLEQRRARRADAAAAIRLLSGRQTEPMIVWQWHVLGSLKRSCRFA